MKDKLARLAYSARMFRWAGDPAFWRGRSTPIDRPVFLLGLQGGGLTLLTRMLRRHSAVVSGGGGRDWWTGPDEIQNIFGPVLPADLSGMRWKVPSDAVFGPLRSWSLGTDRLVTQYRRRAEDATPQIGTALRRVIGYSIRRFGSDTPAPRFIDKSQSFVLRLGMIHAALKDCDPHFVLVPRDPYVSVWRAASGKARDMADLMPRTTMEDRLIYCAQHYAACMTAAFEDADRAGIDMPVLTFESLVADPESTLRRLCAHIALPFDWDMVPQAGQDLPFASRFRDRWYPLQPEVNLRYLRQMSPEGFEIVNRHCPSALIERLGYVVRERGDD